MSLELSGALEHLLEPAAQFPARHQMDHERRKRARSGQRPCQALAFAHALDRALDGFPHHHIGHHACAGVKRGEQRHAAADQNGERARKTRSVDAANERPQPRRAQQQGVPTASGRSPAQCQARGGHAADDGDREIRPGCLQEAGEPDEPAREHRQALPRLLKYLHDLRHDKHQEAGDDADRDHRYQNRVKQRQTGFLLQCLARIEIIGKMLQHRRQRAGFLAAVHQRPIEIGKTLVIGAESAGKGEPGCNLGFDAAQHLPSHRRGGLLDQRAERLLHRQAGCEQSRHLPGHQAQLIRRDAAYPRLPRPFARAYRIDCRGVQALGAQLCPRLARRIGLHYPGHRTPGRVQRLVAERLHDAIRASRAPPLQG
ncbi:MAG: hypothetical protein A3G24_09950 [Betaproteobacteria bacterium RIFCSPLOWO2_12_FULL_62_13]|nr:MAG: hypothetical protein A3G24_09950 [Betaproteobacteria bacterium RIFCSPLOWO2_12_FULL_62_13]